MAETTEKMSGTPPVLLCILDGWGEREEEEGNAVALANTPNLDMINAKYPQTTLSTSGTDVGLPDGQMGNSEVGHMNIGCGRVMEQFLPRINRAIAENNLADIDALQDLIQDLKASGGTLHLMGLISDGGVHSHIDHIVALAKIVADEGIEVNIHASLDGRDTPPESGAEYIAELEKEIADYQNISIKTVAGRYYSMDL